MKNPELLSQKVLLQKHRKSLIQRDFRLPDGDIIEYLCFGGVDAVIVFPLTIRNEVIAVRQFRYAVNTTTIELPGGRIDGEETPGVVAEHELLEETGYVAGQLAILAVKLWNDPGTFINRVIPAIATGCERHGRARPEKTELVETMLIPLETWVRQVYAGEIVDMKSIVVTFLALRHLGLS